MKQIFIKPAVHGHLIRHPEKMHHKISQEGEYVLDSVHWQRKLMDGDIVLATPPEEVKDEVKDEPRETKPSAKKSKEGDNQ